MKARSVNTAPLEPEVLEGQLPAQRLVALEAEDLAPEAMKAQGVGSLEGLISVF